MASMNEWVKATVLDFYGKLILFSKWGNSHFFQTIITFFKVDVNRDVDLRSK